MSNIFSGGVMRTLPPVTKNLLIINVGIWIACMLSPSFGSVVQSHLGLHYWGASDFNPIQPVSYMFLHDARGVTHIFFNMFALFMFGRMLEAVWGSKRFMLFYFVCGIGAALVQEGIWTLTAEHDYISIIAAENHTDYASASAFVKGMLASGDAGWVENFAAYKDALTTIGASGAIFGLLLGFAFVFPNVPMYIFFIPIPIKAKYMVMGYAALELLFGASGALSSVAHYAHLGGMLFGLIVILIWHKKGILRGPYC